MFKCCKPSLQQGGSGGATRLLLRNGNVGGILRRHSTAERSTLFQSTP